MWRDLHRVTTKTLCFSGAADQPSPVSVAIGGYRPLARPQTAQAGTISQSSNTSPPKARNGPLIRPLPGLQQRPQSAHPLTASQLQSNPTKSAGGMSRTTPAGPVSPSKGPSSPTPRAPAMGQGGGRPVGTSPGAESFQPRK